MFLPAEVITPAPAEPDAALLRLRPLRPKTPRLLEVSSPAAFNPPAAPDEVAAPTVERAAVSSVSCAAPAAAPAADATPPRAPRGLPMLLCVTAPLAAPLASISISAPERGVRGAAM